jgi:hypothetical protein
MRLSNIGHKCDTAERVIFVIGGISKERAAYRHFRYISPCGQTQAGKSRRCQKKMYSLYLKELAGGGRKPQPVLARELPENSSAFLH